MLLDEIIENLNKNEHDVEEKIPESKDEPTGKVKSRLAYSDEFWARFQKQTTAPDKES